MRDELFLLDSNILVYAYDRSDQAKHRKARILLEGCFRGERTFAVSIQNLNEFYTIVTTRIEHPLDKEDALERIKSILDFDGFKILVPTPQAILTAIHLNIASGKPYWDCFLASTMLENRVFHIYTENRKDFGDLPGIIPFNLFG